MSPNWYDDGPVDLTSGFPALEKLRKTLSTTKIESFADQCEKALAPLGLNAITLPLVLALPEFKERPNLVVPLLPALKTTNSRENTWVLAMEHLLALADDERVVKLLQTHALTYLSNSIMVSDERVMKQLARLHPSLLLRALRQTHRRGVPIAKEPPARRYWTARAYEGLYRPQQARHLYNTLLGGYFEAKAKFRLQRLNSDTEMGQ
ncbi:MAG: hypothetical protein HN348_35515 [Proteobacteria bacterium]|nr:hypothetical protein [Pseudomonadota bacterium]